RRRDHCNRYARTDRTRQALAHRTLPGTRAAERQAQGSGVSVANAMPLLTSLTLPVRWRDLDAFNHVNNSTYLTWIEETRLHWMANLPGEWMNADYSPLLAAVHVNYRRAAAWPANVVVELYCERLGNTSVTLAHRIVDASDR